MSPLASISATSAAPVATLRSAIASDENAPGLLLCVYEDLRERIAQTRQTMYLELAATVPSDLLTNIDQLETRVDSLSSECRFLRIRLAAAEDRVRDLESPSVSTASLVNISTPTPLAASVPYSISHPPVSNAHSSQVGAASQTPTTPRIWTPIPHPDVSATTPYSSSISPLTIPNTSLSHPVTYEQFLGGELARSMSQLHTIHALSSLRPPQPQNPLYDTTRVPGLEPKRSLLPPFATSRQTNRTSSQRKY